MVGNQYRTAAVKYAKMSVYGGEMCSFMHENGPKGSCCYGNIAVAMYISYYKTTCCGDMPPITESQTQQRVETV